MRYFIAWIVLSIPFALLVGAIIRAGKGQG